MIEFCISKFKYNKIMHKTQNEIDQFNEIAGRIHVYEAETPMELQVVNTSQYNNSESQSE